MRTKPAACQKLPARRQIHMCLCLEQRQQHFSCCLLCLCSDFTNGRRDTPLCCLIITTLHRFSCQRYCESTFVICHFVACYFCVSVSLSSLRVLFCVLLCFCSCWCSIHSLWEKWDRAATLPSNGQTAAVQFLLFCIAFYVELKNCISRREKKTLIQLNVNYGSWRCIIILCPLWTWSFQVTRHIIQSIVKKVHSLWLCWTSLTFCSCFRKHKTQRKLLMSLCCVFISASPAVAGFFFFYQETLSLATTASHTVWKLKANWISEANEWKQH